MCQWASRQTAAGTPSAPTNPDITAPSSAANIVVTWTNPSPMGTSNEVWKSSDGVTFVLFSTVGGGVSQVTDATGLAVNAFAYYKIRSCNGASCSAFSSTISACNTYTSPNVAAISFPTLIRAFGGGTSFKADGLAALVSVSLPALVRVDGALDLANNPALTTLTFTSLNIISAGGLLLASNNLTGAISFPALTFVGADVQFQSNANIEFQRHSFIGGNLVGRSCAALTSVVFTSLATIGAGLDMTLETLLAALSFPALTSVGGVSGGDIVFNGCPALVSASFPALTTTNPINFFVINGSSCAAFTTISIPQLVITDGFIVTFDSCLLSAASVNQVLARGIASGVTATDFELNSPGNAAPSGQGVVDKAALILAGNTCNTN